MLGKRGEIVDGGDEVRRIVSEREEMEEAGRIHSGEEGW